MMNGSAGIELLRSVFKCFSHEFNLVVMAIISQNKTSHRVILFVYLLNFYTTFLEAFYTLAQGNNIMKTRMLKAAIKSMKRLLYFLL